MAVRCARAPIDGRGSMTEAGQDIFDLIVIGAGAAGMTAAAVAAAEGLRPLVLEKTETVGGTASVSGGMVWIPCNDLTAAAGAPDSQEAATQYLDATVPTDDWRDMRMAFLRAGREAIDYLQCHTAVKLKPVNFYPDYYPGLEGATSGGRVLEPVPFDASVLCDSFVLLRPPMPEFMLLGGMMVGREDIPHFRKMKSRPASFLRVAQLVAQYGLQRLGHPRGTRLVLGNALAGQLLASLLARNVPILTRQTVREFIRVGGRVKGVMVESPAGLRRIVARRGVMIATGGFSHDREMRRQFLPADTSPYSPFAPGSTGDGLRLGVAAGGVIEDGNSDNAFWAPASVYRRADGRTVVYPHTVTDRGKPGSLVVNAAGRRFTNEAVSYHEFGRAMFRAHNEGRSIPAHMICDRDFLWKYGLGAIIPFTRDLAPYKQAGYLIEAASLAELAAKIGVDSDGLKQTAATFNADAATGKDSAFGRGSDTYGRYLGDLDHGPNPCLGPCRTPPFYAIELVPSDLGTVAGLRTNADAQVLDSKGRPIAGLYAAGNDMRSIMCGSYPGPGITLGPALTFGYLAARHAGRSGT